MQTLQITLLSQGKILKYITFIEFCYFYEYSTWIIQISLATVSMETNSHRFKRLLKIIGVIQAYHMAEFETMSFLGLFPFFLDIL
jgi:hypothetical protein